VTEAGEQVGEGPDELRERVAELLRAGRNTLLELDDGRKVFAEIYGPPPRLLVIGRSRHRRGAVRGGEAARLADDRRRRPCQVRDEGADPERGRAARGVAAGRGVLHRRARLA
jgi:hypothetical protein